MRHAERHVPEAVVQAWRPRILVLDDAKFVRELLRLHLSNAGYEVMAAEDAIVGGRMLLESRPDLIITDVQMPYMSGLDFIAALRADPEIPDIPVIFISSHDDAAPRARHLMAAAYLVKPVSADRLLDVVALHVPSGPPPAPIKASGPLAC